MDAIFTGIEMTVGIICIAFAGGLGIYMGIDAGEKFVNYLDKCYGNRRVAYKIREDNIDI